MIGKVKTDVDYYKFASTCSKWEFEKCVDSKDIGSFIDLIRFIIAHNGLIVCGEDSGEVMWADEIRFNYTNGEIYLPYIHSQYREVDTNSKVLLNKYKRNVVAYNNFLDRYVIYSKGKFSEKYLYFIVEIDGDILCSKVSTQGMVLNNLESLSVSAKELYRKYIRQSYGYTLCENDNLDFYGFSKSKISSLELQLLRNNSLEYYGEYEETEFNRSMCYKIEDLLKYYTQEELGITLNYNIKRFEFESELFCGIEAGHEWDGWTKGDMKMFNSSKNYFCKYKEHEFYFIFKKKWLEW